MTAPEFALPAFVDTNILVYAVDAAQTRKQPIAKAVLTELWNKRSGRLSVQVLNEYYVTVTRKLSPGLSEQRAWEDVGLFSAWEPLGLDFGALELARHVQLRFGLSWWDSLIIAAAIKSDCRTLLSEDLSEGQDYLGVRVVNPFS